MWCISTEIGILGGNNQIPNIIHEYWFYSLHDKIKGKRSFKKEKHHFKEHLVQWFLVDFPYMAYIETIAVKKTTKEESNIEFGIAGMAGVRDYLVTAQWQV